MRLSTLLDYLTTSFLNRKVQGGQRGVRGQQGRRPRDHGGHLPGDQEPRDRPGQGRGEGAGVQGILVKRTDISLKSHFYQSSPQYKSVTQFSLFLGNTPYM